MVPFEERVKGFTAVLEEGSRLIAGKGELNASAARLAEALDAAHIPYALIGAFAVIHHGHVRLTTDLDVLVTPENLKRAHEALVGRGYRPVFEHSKNLRDTINGVRIDVVVSGGFPGDGKPKPIAFPDPSAAPTEVEAGVRFLALEPLVELKLASAMTGGEARGKDYSDVYDLIRARKLDEDFAGRLHEYVRPKFLVLLAQARAADAAGEM